MRGFSRRATVQQALAWLNVQVGALPAERVPLAEAAGRVLAEPVVSTADVPGFNRAMMDGFAVKAACVAGAAPYNPIVLELIGEAFPGRGFEGELGAGQAVKTMTGAPLPAGANAILPAELTESDRRGVRALGEVAPGKHVGLRGEDVVAGATVLEAGRRLRPQDLGVLSSIGHDALSCVRLPRVGIVLTGNELLPAGTAPSGHQITDANGPMLSALARRDGAGSVHSRIVADDRMAILAAAPRRCGRGDRVWRIECGARGLCPLDPGGRRTAGDPRHRDASQQSDGHGTTGLATRVFAAWESGIVPVCVRLLRGSRNSHACGPRTGVALSGSPGDAGAQDQLRNRTTRLCARHGL